MTQIAAFEADYSRSNHRKKKTHHHARRATNAGESDSRESERHQERRKQNQAEGQNNKTKTPIEMQKGGREPETLERLLGEWVDQEEEPDDKADQKRQTSK